MTGKTVCYHHGGKTPTGIALPQTKSGRYSSVLPARLLPSYEAAQHDPRLLELSEQVAVLDSRIIDVLGRVDSGESGALWAAARKAFEDFRKAQAGGPTKLAEAMLALSDLDTLLTKGLADYAAWADVRLLFQERRKLVESERKRMLEAQQYIAVEQTLLLIQLLADSVKRNVSDPQARQAIQSDITRVLSGPLLTSIRDARESG